MVTKNLRRLATRTAVVALVVGGVGITAAGAASAAPLSADAPTTSTSYTLTSSPLTVGTGIGDSASMHGMCADGFHVRGTLVPDMQGNGRLVPTVTLDGGSDMYVKSSGGTDHNGGNDRYGWDWTYQGLNVALGNHSWSQTQSATVTWTCDPN